MRSFVLRVLGFTLLQAAIALALLRVHSPRPTENYLAQTIPKHRRLATTPAPRLILVGGSSMAFGARSEPLETNLGRPVVNMGLAAGLGAEFMLAEVAPHLRSNDVLLLSLEYDHFARGPNEQVWSERGYEPEILRQVLTFRPAGFRHLSGIHLRRILLDRGLSLTGELFRDSLRALPSAWSAPASTPFPPIPGFNRWGDHVIADSPSPSADPLASASQSPPISTRLVADERGFPSPVLLRRLERFVRVQSSRGVRVVWSFPPKPEPALALHAHLAHRLHLELARIPGLLVLDSPEAQTYPLDQFHGSANHLAERGAYERTRRWIESLRRQLPASFPGTVGSSLAPEPPSPPPTPAQ